MKNALFALIVLTVFSSYAQQDSLNMRKLSQWTYPLAGAYNDCWGYTANNREYAIFGSNWGTHFIDITAPSSPVEVASFPGKSTNVVWRDFKTYQHYCYGVADGAQNSLQIFDLQYLPDSVVKVYDSTEFTISTHNIYIDGNRLYLNDNHRGSLRYPMEILSLANPVQPTLIGTLGPVVGQGSSEVHDAYVRNDTVYASRGFSGHFIYDFRDPQSPVQIAHVTGYPEQGYCHSSWVHPNGRYWVLADETHGTALKLYDITNKSNPRFMGLFRSNPGAIAHNPFIRGDSIYISYYHDGARVFSLEDTSNILQVAYYDTYPNNVGYPGYQGAWGVYPFFPSGTLIASDISTGLYALELLPVSVAPNAQASIETQTGCAPFEVKFRNNSTGAFSYQWDFGDPGSGNNTSTSSATIVSHVYQSPGNYTARLVAFNPVGSDTAFVNVVLNGNVVVTLPYFEDFETGASSFCLFGASQATVRYANSNGNNLSKSLEFTGGNGINFTSSACNQGFINNPDFVSRASIAFDGTGFVPDNLILSFGARLRWSIPPMPISPDRSRFRVFLNDSLLVNCIDTPGVIYSEYAVSLNNYFKPNTTNVVVFEAMNRFLNNGTTNFNSVFIDDISIENVTGISEDASPSVGIKVFPNPSSNVFNIEYIGGQRPSLLEVYNSNGTMVHVTSSGMDRIDLGLMPSGLYLLRAKYTSVERSFRLLLVHD